MTAPKLLEPTKIRGGVKNENIYKCVDDGGIDRSYRSG